MLKQEKEILFHENSKEGNQVASKIVQALPAEFQ